MSGQLQHYIPRFILRRVGDSNGWLYAYDKRTGGRFKVRTSGNASLQIAAERGMYEFEFLDTPLTMEPALSRLESAAAVHISRIEESSILDLVVPEERATLAHFLAVQMVRTRAILETQRDVFGRMKTWLRADGASDDFFRPDLFVGEGENAEKALRAQMICNANEYFAPAIAEKDWLLFKTDSSGPFLIGDHPFAMFNEVDRSPRGNLGLKVRGIQLYFPFSPRTALAMWCPSLQRELLDGIARLDSLSVRRPDVAAQHMDTWKATLEIVEAIQKGTALVARPENVVHFNSLQVSYAEQFVFSNTDDFGLVEDMIRDDPRLRVGRRLEEVGGKF